MLKKRHKPEEIVAKLRQVDVLIRFAARTYAPATEASRLSGAGAGTTDND